MLHGQYALAMADEIRNTEYIMIIAENLNMIFRQGTKAVHAVEGMNMHIKKGERVLIHGPSGAGKSTFLHMMGGLSRPSGGTIRFFDKDIYKLSDRGRSKLRNRHFGFIFQFYHLLSDLNVLENVMLPARMKGGETVKNMKLRAESFLEAVGLENRMTHKPSQLSGGEMQRAAIARSLINSPDVLFCDEPTGNLDSEMSAEIYDLIYEISEKNGMSVIVVSHQEVNEGFSDSEYMMVDGMLHEPGKSGSGARPGKISLTERVANGI